MATRRKSDSEVHLKSGKTRRPATTPDGRENQMIALSMDLAERQLRDGTASSQVMVHFLKLGSSREKLEQERIAREVELAGAKIEIMQSQKRIEELYGEALNAMRSYSGQAPSQMEIEDED